MQPIQHNACYDKLWNSQKFVHWCHLTVRYQNKRFSKWTMYKTIWNVGLEKSTCLLILLRRSSWTSKNWNLAGQAKNWNLLCTFKTFTSFLVSWTSDYFEIFPTLLYCIYVQALHSGTHSVCCHLQVHQHLQAITPVRPFKTTITYKDVKIPLGTFNNTIY